MKNKNILSCVLLVVSPITIFAGFNGTSTYVDEKGAAVDKIHGTHKTLTAYEDVEVFPYGGAYGPLPTVKVIAKDTPREKWNSDVGLTKIEKYDEFPCENSVPAGVTCKIIVQEDNYTEEPRWYEQDNLTTECIQYGFVSTGHYNILNGNPSFLNSPPPNIYLSYNYNIKFIHSSGRTYYNEDKTLKATINPGGGGRRGQVYGKGCTEVGVKQFPGSGLRPKAKRVPGDPNSLSTIQAQKIYTVHFNYDTTPPEFGGLVFYEDQAGRHPIPHLNVSSWINTPAYYSVVCFERETKCKLSNTMTQVQDPDGTIRSTPKLIGHMMDVSAYFTNTVNLSAIVRSGATHILYDIQDPILDLKIQNTLGVVDTEINNNSRSHEVSHFVADTETQIILTITDEATAISGISGIQKYTVDIKKGSTSVYHHEKTYDPYNPTGTIEINDIKTIDITTTPDTTRGFDATKAGDYEITITATDHAGNSTEKTANFKIHPNIADANKTTLTIHSLPSENSLYADGQQQYKYTLKLRDAYDNPIPTKDFTFAPICNPGKSDKNRPDYCTPLTTNMVNNTGDNALRITPQTFTSSATESTSDIQFLSLAPGEFTPTLQITHKKWNNKYENTGEKNIIYVQTGENTFRKPYTGKLVKIRPTGPIRLATKTDFELQVTRHALPTTHYQIKDFIPDLKTLDRAHSLKNKSAIVPDGDAHKFSTHIIMASNSSILIRDNIGLQIAPHTEIYYTLDEKEIRYILTHERNQYGLTPPPIQTEPETLEFLGVQIIGTAQSTGYADISINKENFSDISVAGQRSKIRQNTLSAVKNMKSGNITNRIKYISGRGTDVKITDEDIGSYDTLVVHGRNVIIDTDITKEKFGIIVLTDNYDVKTLDKGLKGTGNIYVTPNVKKITGLLYADGGILSADTNGNVYKEDKDTLYTDLKTQLVITGSLFTRNTIGGSIQDPRILPGGSTTNNGDLAVLYDLNNLRRGLSLCEPKSLTDTTCQYDKGSTVIVYNPKLAQNPPPLFK